DRTPRGAGRRNGQPQDRPRRRGRGRRHQDEESAGVGGARGRRERLHGPAQMTRVELVISGRVQGVFYRASAQQEAQRLGLHGEIRNLPGGEVEAVVEGEQTEVDEFIAWCRRGPPAADVEDVRVTYGPPRREVSGFRVT